MAKPSRKWDSPRQCPSPGDILATITDLSKRHEDFLDFSSFSTAIYDTAWLAMVCRQSGTQIEWLYPHCFNYILGAQQSDGLWPSYSSSIDGILNSLVCLLCLVKRNQVSGRVSPDGYDGHENRIRLARNGLQMILSAWNVDDTAHVGFEMLVPSLLRQLQASGITFDFPRQKRLMDLNALKLKNFTPSILYSARETTLLHSLESFIGLIDFDKVRHHCNEYRGVLGSPAATAAYLMQVTRWDNSAESYLDKVVQCYSKDGGVPNAFPTCLFEISWATSTLLSSTHFRKDCSSLLELKSLLSSIMQDQGGTVGFAPQILSDADDTARLIISLQLLGQDVCVDEMIRQFESHTHFKTYVLERNPSFSANCNVLLALLNSCSVDNHLNQIVSCLNFLIDTWTKGKIKDKWNVSAHYSHMLLTDALVTTLIKHNNGHLQRLPPDLVKREIPMVIGDVLLQTFSGQGPNGSWEFGVEPTAYCVITLVRCLCLPLNGDIRKMLHSRISQGQDYIRHTYSGLDSRPSMWIEKTTYSPAFLRATYCSAALHAVERPQNWSDAHSGIFDAPEIHSKTMRYLFSQLPLFEKSPLTSIDLVLMVGARLSERLQKEQTLMLPKRRDEPVGLKPQYLRLIPSIWIASNHLARHVLSPELILEMSILSLLVYQVDELMESIVIEFDEPGLKDVASVIEEFCSGTTFDDTTENTKAQPLENEGDHASTKGTCLKALRCFINHVLRHEKVVRSPRLMQEELAFEVRQFLHAHLCHISQNQTRQQAQQNSSSCSDAPGSSVTPQSYYRWVQSTAADDTSCPFAAKFYFCLISPPGQSCLQGCTAKYIAASLMSHLASMCRQYNDCGSVSRDADECNLNSLDFPDFHAAESINTTTSLRNGHTPTGSRPTLRESKAKLMAIAQFEREIVNMSFERLKAEPEVSPATIRATQVFVDVTDLFGQIYVFKDFTSHVCRKEQDGDD